MTNDKCSKCKKEVPETFDHHILLYAKNWYKKSGDILKDLGVLLSVYTGNHDTTIGDVRECLCNCYVKYVPACNSGRALQEMLGWGWYDNMHGRTAEAIMLDNLSIADGKYVDPTKLLPVLVK